MDSFSGMARDLLCPLKYELVHLMNVSHSTVPELSSTIQRLIETRDFGEAECMLKGHIFRNPLDANAFGLLAKIRLLLGQSEAARVADRRFQQLRAIESNSKLTPLVEQYQVVRAHIDDPDYSIECEGFTFAGLRLHKREGRNMLLGRSLDGQAFLKVELQTPQAGKSNLPQEAEVAGFLTGRGCMTCAKLLGSGTFEMEVLQGIPAFKEPLGQLDASLGRQKFPYVLFSYHRADRGGFGLADVALALLEQQSLGVYQNCLSLAHIRFDSLEGICRLSNFRNAEMLEDSVRRLPPRDFLRWCFEREAQRITQDGSSSFLTGREVELDKLFQSDKFLLVRAQLFGKQRIADVPLASVQDVSEGPFDLLGSVRVEDRFQLLDQLDCKSGERVLDLGCGAGAVSRYFAKRGCEVTAIDCDEQLLRQVTCLSNLSATSVKVYKCDLEYDFPGGNFDTVAALVLISQLNNRMDCARRIADSGCKRILIECACNEPGYRWQGSFYHPVDEPWEHESAQDLQSAIQSLFPDFRDIQLLGRTNSDRFLFVLNRKESAE